MGMKHRWSGKDDIEANVDQFIEDLATAGVICERDRVAWFVDLHHRSEPFWASLLYLAKEGRKWSVVFTFTGDRDETSVEAVCARYGFPPAEARTFAMNVTAPRQSDAAA